MNKQSDLRVWWIGQLGTKPFHQTVRSMDEGKFLIGVLAKYDIHQLQQNIRPDFANAGGVQVYLEDIDENQDGVGAGVWVDMDEDVMDEDVTLEDMLS